jgi:glycosyl transferase family 87
VATTGGLAAFDTPNVRRVLVLGAIVGLLLGIETVVLHLTTDPLADVHAYYDAGARLNAGQPLYDQPASTNEADFYRYPPLLAILFRPLALLPFGLAAAIWMTLIGLMFVATIVRLDLRRPLTLFVVCALALPTGWSIVIGQAQVAVTLLLALGNPWAIALAANLKVFPILVAVWWLGRRDWRPLGWLAVWVVALIGFQLVVAPSDTLAYLSFLRLDQVGSVISLSPYAMSPLLWAAMVVGLVVLAIWSAPRRYGWAVAVTLSVLASPRLLLYQLSSLVAGVRDPDDR